MKKDARELRMKAMSDGLSSFDFSMVPVNYVNDVNMELGDEDMSQNGVPSPVVNGEESTKANRKLKTPKKRLASESQKLPLKSSKKKK